MAQTPISLLLLRRLSLSSQNPKPPLSLFTSLSHRLSLKPYSTSYSYSSSPDQQKPSSLSARMSFVFDQIDAIERERAQKDESLQRIRAWRQSKDIPQQQQQKPETVSTQNPEIISSRNEELESGFSGNGDSSSGLTDSNSFELVEKKQKDVEVVHPWPEWVDLMERLVRQNYFDHRRKNEDRMVQNLGLDVLGFGNDDVDNDVGVDFKDFKAVQTAIVNFGKDRFDILRSLSRQDIQILVGYGCPSADKKVVLSAKLLRKHVHLDEGDVCSNCSLRSTCERAYLLTNKEDEARTIDVMRVLLTYGFDPSHGSVVNKSLLKQKSVKTVVHKLLHEVVKLSAVPIDPNLPPPVIKKPPPKVKQPPPPPKKRVGRDDVEMKKGDWLCPKCDFMNFAKNTVCLQCDAKRPKRELLPGEWECPECNFLNYRRNMACFHCDCKRPLAESVENKIEKRQHGFKPRLEKIAHSPGVSNAWNFDFDDNESDGADVAAFEYADSAAMGEDFPSGGEAQGGNFRGREDDLNQASRISNVHEREHSDPDRDRFGMGFDDFDDEDDVDSYEVDTQNNKPVWKASRNNFSEQKIFESEDIEDSDENLHTLLRTTSLKPMHQKAVLSGSDDELDIDSDEELSVHPKWKSSHVADARHKNEGRGPKGPSRGLSFGSDEELELGSDSDDEFGTNQRKQSRWSSSKRNFQRSSEWEDASFSGSESDNNNLRSQGYRSGGNKKEPGRRGNMFGGRDDYGYVRDEKARSKGKTGDRSKSWDNDFDRSPPRSHGKNRGFRGNDHAGRRMNDRGSDFWNFTGPKREGFQKRQGGRSNKYDMDVDGNPGEFRNRRFQGNDHAGHRVNDRGSDFLNFKGPKREGFQKRRGERSNEYNRNMDCNPDEFRNSRRVIER